MKRIFALVLVLCMAVSLCTLTACKKEEPVENIYADFEKFDSYVPAGSDIIGKWAMTSPETDREWQFFANTTLHMTRIHDDVRTSTVCTYNYDGEGNLRAYIFTGESEEAYTVVLEGESLVLTDSEGVKYTFEKIK
ncbi:MAG: hypothetical protein IJ346_04905 [Clostridia bacterium]|nr:hypothetical protein [Clostridia bacterium]